MTLNPDQFHATLHPSPYWAADEKQHSAEVRISNPENPTAFGTGRLMWDSGSTSSLYITDPNEYNKLGGIRVVEGTHRTLGAAVTALNKQHLSSYRVTKKFKNDEVHPLAQQIQDAGGYDSWKEKNQ